MNVQPDKTNTRNRRGIVLGGLAALAAIVIASNPFRKKNADTPGNKTVKLLAQDGTLIEVDESRIPSQGKRVVSKEELQEWIKR